MDVTYTNHALDVMRRRHVSHTEVLDTVNFPHVTEPAREHLQKRYVRDGLCVVTTPDEEEPDTERVITVLLRTERRWTDADARERRV